MAEKRTRWTKQLLLLIAACTILAFSAVTAHAAPDVAPANLKVEPKTQNEEIAVLTWTNPRGWFTKKAAYTEDDVYYIHFYYSDDNQETWNVLKTNGTIQRFDYNMLSPVDTSIETDALEHGKSYYFRVCYADYDEEDGPFSNVFGPLTWSTSTGRNEDTRNNAVNEVKKLSRKKGKVTETGGYSATKAVKKGMKVVYDRGAYKLTVETDDVSTSANYKGKIERNVKFKVTLESKVLEYADLISDTFKITSEIKDDDGDRINASWSYPAEGSSATSFVRSYDTPGYKKLTFTVGDNNSLFKKTEVFSFAVTPSGNNTGNLEVTKNSITFKDQPDYRQLFQYRKKGAASWKKKYSSSSTVSFKKLKPNTLYEFRIRAEIKTEAADGTSKTMKSPWIKTQIRTARKTKPTVIRAYTSGAKYKKWTEKGHWVTGTVGTTKTKTWEPTKTYSSTAYTVHLKVKKPSGVKGFIYTINGGVEYQTKKATIKTPASSGGNVVGKTCTVKICSCTNSDFTGRSPWKTIKIRIQ